MIYIYIGIILSWCEYKKDSRKFWPIDYKYDFKIIILY